MIKYDMNLCVYKSCTYKKVLGDEDTQVIMDLIFYKKVNDDTKR